MVNYHVECDRGGRPLELWGEPMTLAHWCSGLGEGVRPKVQGVACFKKQSEEGCSEDLSVVLVQDKDTKKSDSVCR